MYTLKHICSNIHVQFGLFLYKVFKRLISVDMWIFARFSGKLPLLNTSQLHLQ